jgi:hypothetical protein
MMLISIDSRCELEVGRHKSQEWTSFNSEFWPQELRRIRVSFWSGSAGHRNGLEGWRSNVAYSENQEQGTSIYVRVYYD